MVADLPAQGKIIDTDNGKVIQADQFLLATLNHLDDVYGWVQVLKVLRDHVAPKYASGKRFADYLIEKGSQ